MSRLHVGGLALVIHDNFEENLMKTVQITGYKGDVHYCGKDFFNCWHVYCEQGLLSTNTETGLTTLENEAFTPAAWLMPLGDDKGIELYGLREEEKELVGAGL